MVFVILFTLFPFYWMLKSSFQTPADILALPPIWFPTQFTLDGYIRAVTLYPVPRYLLNSLFVSSADGDPGDRPGQLGGLRDRPL